jgi:hypothetical protein
MSEEHLSVGPAGGVGRPTPSATRSPRDPHGDAYSPQSDYLGRSVGRPLHGKIESAQHQNWRVGLVSARTDPTPLNSWRAAVPQSSALPRQRRSHVSPKIDDRFMRFEFRPPSARSSAGWIFSLPVLPIPLGLHSVCGVSILQPLRPLACSRLGA